MKRLLLFFTLYSSFIISMSAQGPNWEQYLTDIYENEEGAVVQMEEAYELLTELARQPLDINKVGLDELMQIPGLTQYQVNDILEYRHRYGNLRSVDELAMIPSIDRGLRLYLTCFLTVREDSPLSVLRSPLKNLHHDLVFTLQTPTYYRAGDMNAPAHTYLGKNKYAGKYLGDPVKHSLRSSLAIGSVVTFNLSGSKTAGEPFGTNGNKWGYDQYAFNITLRNIGIFNQIVAGQFRGQFGMGLVLNNNFTIGKQGMLSAMNRRTTMFTPHSSTSDSRHLQGVAANVSIADGLSVAAFLSCRYIDATLNTDGSISTILTSGYHRTVNEMQKKNNATQTTAGAHVSYDFSIRRASRHDFSLGASVLYTTFNRPLNPTFSKSGKVTPGKVYRLYYPRGYNFMNVGIDYAYRWHDLSFSGETAVDDGGNPATINSLTWHTPWNFTLMALQRYYSYQYNALYGKSFAESSTLKNESGVYLGVQWNVIRDFTLEAYTDVAYFAYPRYLVSASSYSWDNSVTGKYTKGNWTHSLRYRLKMKQRDKTVSGTKQLLTRYDHRLRYLAAYNGNVWTLRTQAEGCTLSFDDTSRGFILSQSVGYKTVRNQKSNKPLLDMYALIAWFNTKDYDSRLYTYERGMLYSFGSASYYGRGIRAALLVRYNPLKCLSVQGKVGHTRYFDRTTIGDAERMIFAPYHTDIDMQILLRL